MVKMAGMNKTEAIDLLGGTPVSAAKTLGCSRQAVDKWPPMLPRRISDRVLGAWVRVHKPDLVSGLYSDGQSGVVHG